MKFIPHDYQAYAIEFILTHPESLMILDMGLGSQDGDFADGDTAADV